MSPDNAGFLYAAYALTAFLFAGYAALLVRRRARARQRLRDLASGGGALGRGDGPG